MDNRQTAYEKYYKPYGIDEEKVYEDMEDGSKRILSQALEQEKGKGGFMLDLSIGKSIRMKKGQLSVNLQLTNLLNNTSIVTGEQSRSGYSVNTTTGELGNSARIYKFDKNPKKYYAYGINGMLNIGYRF